MNMVKEIMAKIANVFVKGAACTVVINKSADSKMRKGTKSNRNPFLGRVILRTIMSGFVMGTDYSASLRNTAGRIGNKEAEPNLKKVWHHPVRGLLGEWFSTNKTEDKFYLKLQRNEMQIAHSTDTEYFLDGRPATQEEVYLIQSWMPDTEKKQSSTQVEMGIDKAHEQHFILVALDNLALIKQGDRVWCKDGFKVSSVEVEPAYSTSQSRG